MEKERKYLRAKTPENLYLAVVDRIYAEKRKAVKRHMFYTGFAILASLGAFAEVFATMISSLARSGFYSYFSLIFSDGLTLFSSWKEFSMSLVESFSLTEFIVLLSLSFAIMIFVRMIVREINLYKIPKFKTLQI